MEYLEEFLEIFGYNKGYNDIVALVPGNYKDILFSADISDIKHHHIFPVSNMEVGFNTRLEPTPMIGAVDKINIAGSTLDLGISFQVPIFSPAQGFVQASFASLWSLAGLAVYGTPLAIKTEILSYNDETRLVSVDNVIEFEELLSQKSSLLVSILDQNQKLISNIMVSGADKIHRTLQLGSSLPDGSKFLVFIDDTDIVTTKTIKSPTFLLWSLGNGLIGPCLIDTITITANSKEELTASVTIKALKIDRSYQVALYNCLQNITQDYDFEQIITPILGNTIKLYLAPGLGGTYNSYQYFGKGLTTGFQTPHIQNEVIYNTTFSIKNNLTAEFADDSLSEYPERTYENSFPTLIYSSGRLIEGTVEVYSPLQPSAVLEKLVGNGYINSLNNALQSGLKLDYSNFALTIPGVVWSPGERKVPVNEESIATLKWYSYNQTSYSYPDLEYSTLDIV